MSKAPEVTQFDRRNPDKTLPEAKPVAWIFYFVKIFDNLSDLKTKVMYYMYSFYGEKASTQALLDFQPNTVSHDSLTGLSL